MPSNTCRSAMRFLAAMALPAWIVLGIASVAAAQPGSSVTVKADQAKLVALSGDPATVLIGNALFAELTLKKGMIVIHGRQYGTTNVIVLDKNNAELANFELHVVRGGSQNVTVRKGTSAYSYMCAPGCEGALQVGDNADHFGAISSAMSTKLQLSTGASQSSK